MCVGEPNSDPQPQPHLPACCKMVLAAGGQGEGTLGPEQVLQQLQRHAQQQAALLAEQRAEVLATSSQLTQQLAQQLSQQRQLQELVGELEARERQVRALRNRVHACVGVAHAGISISPWGVIVIRVQCPLFRCMYACMRGTRCSCAHTHTA